MSSEILAVPEENLREVIAVIREGLKSVKVSRDTKYNLTNWCNEEEEYLDEIGYEGKKPITKKPMKKVAKKKK